MVRVTPLHLGRFCNKIYHSNLLIFKNLQNFTSSTSRCHCLDRTLKFENILLQDRLLTEYERELISKKLEKSKISDSEKDSDMVIVGSGVSRTKLVSSSLTVG